MSKKIGIPVLIALAITLVAGVVISSNALAQGETPLRRLLRARPVVGQVTAVGKAEFSIEKKDGTKETFKVDDNTRYRSKDQGQLSFSDLKQGQWVAVVAGRGVQGSGVARFVVTLPEDFDPSQMEGARGKVTSVNPAASQFTIENREGQSTTVEVNDETIFRGQVADLEDLQEGMLAGIISNEADGGDEADGGELLARIVRAGNPIHRFMGDITKVNQAAGTFTLKTRRNSREISFAVDENTRFRSKDNQLSGLKDLKVGMLAIVVTKDPLDEAQGSAPLTAVLVGAADKQDLPQVDLKAGGKVVSLDKNAFTIESRDGKKYTFQVTGDTRFRSRVARSFEDLKVGMPVMVGAKELGNGSYQAQVVIVLQRK